MKGFMLVITMALVAGCAPADEAAQAEPPVAGSENAPEVAAEEGDRQLLKRHYTAQVAINEQAVGLFKKVEAACERNDKMTATTLAQQAAALGRDWEQLPGTDLTKESRDWCSDAARQVEALARNCAIRGADFDEMQALKRRHYTEDSFNCTEWLDATKTALTD